MIAPRTGSIKKKKQKTKKRRSLKSTPTQILISRPYETEPVESNEERERLREWAQDFVLKKVDDTRRRRNNLSKGLACAGCQKMINLKDLKGKTQFPWYEAGEAGNKRHFVFCREKCVTLRKYKEAIRQYCFESDFKDLYNVCLSLIYLSTKDWSCKSLLNGFVQAEPQKIPESDPNKEGIRYIEVSCCIFA